MADETPIDPARTTPSGLPMPDGYVLADQAGQAGPATATAESPAPASPPSGFTDDQMTSIRNMILDALRASLGTTQVFNPDSPGDAHPQMGGQGGGHKLRTGPLNPNRPDTPNNDFIHGVKGKLKFTPIGGSVAQVFDIEQISFDDDIDTDDISNTSSSGWKTFLDGLESITGQITFVYDALNVPTVSPLPFRPRTYVTLTVLPDGLTAYTFVALISKFSFSTGPKAGTVRVTCSYMSTGSATFPTVSQTTPTPALH